MVSATLFAILAAAGLTYGWQPDRNAGPPDGSLEYIIQISPDMVGSIEKVGEITSTIDPSIAGRVSRVIVRIGDGPLPRIDPSSDDQVAIAIPTIHPSLHSPIAGLPARNRGPQSVMKPGFGDLDFLNDQNLRQSAETARETAVDAMNRTAGDIGRQAQQFGNDQIQRTTDNARQWINDAAGAAASNLDPRRSAVPGSAGVSGQRTASPLLENLAIGRAGVRQSGPSTEPINDAAQRDPTYRPYDQNFQRPSTDPVRGDSLRGDSLRSDPGLAANGVLPPWQNAGQNSGQNLNQNAGRSSANVGGSGLAQNSLGLSNESLRSNGLRPSESFGQFAGTSNLPQRSPSLDPRTNANPTIEDPRIGSTAAGEKRLIDRDNRILTTTELSPNLRAIGGVQIYQGQLYDQNNRVVEMSQVENALNSQFARRDQSTADLDRNFSQNSVQAPAPILRRPQENRLPMTPDYDANLTADSRQTNDRRWANLSNQYDDGSRSTASNAAMNRSMGDDSRRGSLFSGDRVDRLGEGRRDLAEQYPVDRFANDRFPAQRYPNDRYPADRYDQDRYPRDSSVNDWDRDRSELSGGRMAAGLLVSENRSRQRGYNDDVQPQSASDLRSGRSASRGRGDDRDIDQSQNDPSAVTVARTSSSANGSGRSEPTISHSTTPLFNGLLLVSAIVNFYLFIWLRNMRIRYRQMIANNRMVETAI